MDGVRLGERLGPFDGCLDAELVRAYAAATRDPSPAAQAGEAVPPVAVVTQIWEAQERARAALVPEALQRAAAGGVHGEHDVVLHRPIRPGEPLRTWVEGHGARAAGRHSLVTLRYTTLDAGGTVVAEQWWTTVYLGVTCEPAGDSAPEHRVPDTARDHPLGTYDVDVDTDAARRYAEVSGDWSAHHFEVEAARRSGAPGVFLHGLCTMALCAQGVVHIAAGGDPERVRRVAVRFAAPMPLGERLAVVLHDAGAGVVGFEARCGTTIVVSNGLAELRA